MLVATLLTAMAVVGLVGDHQEHVAVMAIALTLSVLLSVALIWDNRVAGEKRDARELQLRKLSQAVEQSPESIVITDLQGGIEEENRKAS